MEGTLSQGVRALGLRQSRYWGLAKTHLQHLATAAAINLDRLGLGSRNGPWPIPGSPVSPDWLPWPPRFANSIRPIFHGIERCSPGTIEPVKVWCEFGPGFARRIRMGKIASIFWHTAINLRSPSNLFTREIALTNWWGKSEQYREFIEIPIPKSMAGKSFTAVLELEQPLAPQF